MDLANKYRPTLFDDVIGQDVTVKILKSTVVAGDYCSTYMFSGPTGVGKTTLGRIFSKAILCTSVKDGNPCGVCDSCKAFQEEKNFSYMEIDAASYGGKEDMVKLRDDAYFTSPSGKKIILIDECQDISKQGQDALLKPAEIGSKHLVYMFCTTDPDSIKKTLYDRCTIFNVSKVPSDLIFNRLQEICRKESLSYEDPALKQIAEGSDGHVRNAIKCLEKTILYGAITLDNVKIVTQDYDQEICDLIVYLGSNIVESLKIASRITSRLPVVELYNRMCGMISDTTKFIYGYDDFSPRRKNMLEKIKDAHGYAVIEFLDYLSGRDKYIDRSGLQSDIMLLHHKFCSGSFSVSSAGSSSTVSADKKAESSNQEKENVFSHEKLLKLNPSEKGRVLREHRSQRLETKEKEPERVPSEWPLPKENKLGEDSFDESELSPEEFSKLLVGGRGGS